MTPGNANGADPLRSADAGLSDAYAGIRAKRGKGATHARTVAAVLRRCGCEEPVQVAGLLHDVVEDTPWTLDDVRGRFGAPVADLVGALTEDESIAGYRPRKRALREQIAAAGPDAVDIALADKVASLGYALEHAGRLPRRKFDHYVALLAISRGHERHPGLAREVAELLARVAARDGRVADPDRA